jgi:hypothetical protein
LPGELHQAIRLFIGRSPSLRARNAFDVSGDPNTAQELLFGSFLHTEIPESLMKSTEHNSGEMCPIVMHVIPQA